MWLKDDGGADIKGSVTVQGREGSIEVIGFGHGVNLPVDYKTGDVTGARKFPAPSCWRSRCLTRLHHIANLF
nr:type VI secretion system tube protein Hcp [Burkholderia guangdongensis]